MPLREFAATPYIPLLSVRPAEMKALEELPERDKNQLLPMMSLRPWTTAHYLDSAVSRVEEAYGRRPIIFDIDLLGPVEGPRRPVHDEIDLLRDASGGYSNWCDFITQRENVIPCLQLDEPAEIESQASTLAALGRGIVLRFRQQQFGLVTDIAEAIAGFVDGEACCIVLDYERQSRELLARAAVVSTIANRLTEILPGCAVVPSASTFPDSFVGVSEQVIFERQFFGIVAAETEANLVYSDRGSARATSQQGGGGQPTPRIDNALANQWLFYRDDTTEDRGLAYERAALRATGSARWDSGLRLWGSQMIERTALGDRDAISSPARSTAVRINVHLHQQLFFEDPAGLYETDEEWTD